MERDKIFEALKTINDVEPSENFRENLYRKIERKIEKKRQRQVIVPMRIFTLSTAISFAIILFVSLQMVGAAQKNAKLEKLSPILERISPFTKTQVNISDISSLHSCYSMLKECLCPPNGEKYG